MCFLFKLNMRKNPEMCMFQKNQFMKTGITKLKNQEMTIAEIIDRKQSGGLPKTEKTLTILIMRATQKIIGGINWKVDIDFVV